MVKDLPANTGDKGWIPDPGRSHMAPGSSACAPQLLSLYSGAQEPRLPSPGALGPVLLNKRSHRSKKHFGWGVAPALCN